MKRISKNASETQNKEDKRVEKRIFTSSTVEKIWNMLG